MKGFGKNDGMKKEAQIRGTVTGTYSFFGKNVKVKNYTETIRVKDPSKRGAVRDLFMDPHLSVEREVELLDLITDLQETGPHETAELDPKLPAAMQVTELQELPQVESRGPQKSG
jgi:hypothetical protein